MSVHCRLRSNSALLQTCNSPLALIFVRCAIALLLVQSGHEWCQDSIAKLGAPCGEHRTPGLSRIASAPTNCLYFQRCLITACTVGPMPESPECFAAPRR